MIHVWFINIAFNCKLISRASLFQSIPEFRDTVTKADGYKYFILRCISCKDPSSYTFQFL